MVKKGILIAVLIIVALVIMVQFPKIFIKKAGSYKSFQLYSNTDIAFDEHLENVLDSVLINLHQSEFSADSDVYELYFVRGTLYERLLRLFGRKNIAFSKFEKHIYSAHPDFQNSKLSRNNNDFEWLNLVQIISHEGTHSQMYKDYYKQFKMQTPFWINEGYAEYISYQPIRSAPGYELSSLLTALENSDDDWLKTEHQAMTPRSYVKSRLLMEYLIDIKQMNIVDIINAPLNPDEIYEEIKAYYE